MTGDFKIKWIDGDREPKCAPDPAFPNGKDCDVSHGRPSCKALLPYPAPRCGMFYVQCKKCGTNVIITTAGRPDDPRSVTLPCDKSEAVH